MVEVEAAATATQHKLQYTLKGVQERLAEKEQESDRLGNNVKQLKKELSEVGRRRSRKGRRRGKEREKEQESDRLGNNVKQLKKELSEGS